MDLNLKNIYWSNRYGKPFTEYEEFNKNSKLYIKAHLVILNLNPHIDIEIQLSFLKAHFNTFGEIDEAKVEFNECRLPYALMFFIDQDLPDLILSKIDKIYFLNHELQLERGQSNFTLYISYINPIHDNKYVRSVCEEYGNITELEFISSEYNHTDFGSAYVVLSSKHSAIVIIDEIKQKTMWSIHKKLYLNQVIDINSTRELHSDHCYIHISNLSFHKDIIELLKYWFSNFGKLVHINAIKQPSMNTVFATIKYNHIKSDNEALVIMDNVIFLGNQINITIKHKNFVF